MLAVAALVGACATSTPAPETTEAPTGKELASSVGDRTRAAEKSDKTGLIIASSEDGAGADSKEEEPAETKPQVDSPVRFQVTAEGLSDAAGSPLTTAPAPTTADAHAELAASAGVPNSKVVEALDKLREAGWQRISFVAEAPKPESTTGDEAPKQAPSPSK